MIDEGWHGFLPAHAVSTIYYLLGKSHGKSVADANLQWLISDFEIAELNKATCESAWAIGLEDFEDGLVAAMAIAQGCEYIVTRNTSDFVASSVSAITPADLLQSLRELD